ncbi:MAG: hypothetical protein DRJ64_08700 [Thermoprotei archaeon]|nr:MAG: hypothetical protein DRJ64_08700 [Thermoprotei archaeon]
MKKKSDYKEIYKEIFGVECPPYKKPLTPLQRRRKIKKDEKEYLKRVYKHVRQEGLSVKDAKDYVKRIQESLG